MSVSFSPLPATSEDLRLSTDLSNDLLYFDVGRFAALALSDASSLAAVLDHTLLRQGATSGQIVELCEEAAQYKFACAMVAPCWVSRAYSVLAGTGVPVGTVIGFPLGASLTRTKREEAAAVVRLGARELDMVINIGWLKSGENAAVQAEVRAIAGIAHDADARIKVILETCLLTLEEKLRASEICVAAGVDFLKTSTGFSIGGATADDVSLLRGVAGGRCGVKAAGGIRTFEDARVMVEAGANRLGTSASVAILESFTNP